MAVMEMPKGHDDSVAYEGSVGKRISHAMKHFASGRTFQSLSHMQLDIVPKGFYVRRDTTWYLLWWYFMVIMSAYSSMFTPFQFGFYTGLPRDLWIVDLCFQVPFILDIMLRFFTAYKDPETFRLVVDHRKIAFNYVKGGFVVELLCCLPWDTIYKGTGHHEGVRCLVWMRVYRFLRVMAFFTKMERNIRINYFLTRILKLVALEVFVTHTAACFYYYLATTVKARSSGYTWLGSTTFGTFSYLDFRSIDIGKLYTTSLYWSVQAITTVGYGDFHAVNIREMIFVMIYISFNMLIGAYLLGNVTGLVVKASATQNFRDKMAVLIAYMNRHQLPHSIRKQIKSHTLLQFETGELLQDEIMGELPSVVRSKVANSIYRHVVQTVPIFRGCSSEFVDELVSRVYEEHYLPGMAVIHQGDESSSFYVICSGSLAEMLIKEDGKVETIQHHHPESVFGEVGVLCNIPQPFTVRVTELCRLLRIGKETFNGLVQIYFNDGRLIINNLLEWKDTDARIGQIASEVTFLVAKHVAELALMVCNATYDADLSQLKHLVKQGANVAKADYDGRTALHLAAKQGHEAVVMYLIREGADVNAVDKFGMTPLMEAVQAGHDHCISVLLDHGAHLQMKDAGAYLCRTVDKDRKELMERLLLAGADPSASDYDRRTALHIAAAEENAAMVKLLMDAGADAYAEDRWNRTPIDEATSRGYNSILLILQGDSGEGKPVRPHRRSLSNVSISSEKEAGVKGQSNSSIRPASSDRRTDSNMSLARSTVGGLEAGMPDYRSLPVRPKGRPPKPEKPASVSATTQNRKRVTVFPFHPRTPAEEQPAGRVDWAPSSMQGILDLAQRHFGKSGSKILNQDGGEIISTDLIMENDKLYVVD